MKAKRLIALLVAFVLVFALSFALIACGEEETGGGNTTCSRHVDTNKDGKCDLCREDMPSSGPEEPGDGSEEPGDGSEEPGDGSEEPGDGSEEPGDGSEDPTPAGDAILVDGGVGKFQFVVASGYSSSVNKAVAMLQSDLKSFGVEVDIASDNKTTIQDCEVLVGAVNTRGDEYKIDEHSFGYDGYCIKLIGTKVLVLGGSEEALLDAIDEFKKEILGISKKTTEVTNVTMTADDSIEIVQDDYTVTSVKIAGNDFRDYVIAVDKKVSEEADVAAMVQENIYKRTGMWLKIVSIGSVKDEDKIFKIDLTTPKTCSSEKGFIVNVKNGDLLIDCGFANKLEEATIGFVMGHITNVKTSSVSIKEGFKYEKEDYKNIYYKDFGAVGDGETDDFFAIKAAHDQANKYGHVVHASPSAVYYLGEGSGYNTITIGTDTYWHGCKFIFDDSQIAPPESDPITGTTISGSKGDPEYYTSIFSITNTQPSKSYSGAGVPFTTLYEGATNIGYAPGFRALIIPNNNKIKHFIRYGANQSAGSAQHEIIIVEADGTIDSTTPVQWNYDYVSSVTVIPMTDEPIVIDGMSDDGLTQTHVDTIFNGAPSYYTYYKRNIFISRPNVTIGGIRHTISEEYPETGAPYSGFIQISNTENVIVENCEFQRPMSHSTVGSGAAKVGMGSYEISAGTSNNLLWRNCTQSNFFTADGFVQSGGMMGTNYCKNLKFDNVFMCSFDAHCGTYNAELRNSSCEHINFIGEGNIILENMKIYADANRSGLCFRSDYGSTWEGNVYIDGFELKYETATWVELFENQWNNHFFGYQTYLPEYVYINNLSTVKFTHKMNGDKRIETILEDQTNVLPVHYSSLLERYTGVNIADPDEDMTAYPARACDCAEFVDANGDGNCDYGRCGGINPANSTKNNNPFIPTKEIHITNSPGLIFILPNTPQFKDLDIYVDDVVTPWRDDGQITIPYAE